MDFDSEMNRFFKAWEIDFSNKIIRRKRLNIFRTLLRIIWKPKYPVIALYCFAQHHLATEAGIVWPNIIEKGSANEIAGVPAWYQLSEEWTIPNSDIESLFLGPLVQGKNFLVAALPIDGFFTSIWQFLIVLAALGGAISFMVMLVEYVLL